MIKVLTWDNHKDFPYKREQKGHSEKTDVLTETELGGMNFGDGGRVHLPRNANSHLKMDKSRTSLGPPEGKEPCQHLC